LALARRNWAQQCGKNIGTFLCKLVYGSSFHMPKIAPNETLIGAFIIVVLH
jgi:hypothetical protein